MDKLISNYETLPVPTFIPSDPFWGNVERYCSIMTDVNSTSAVSLPFDQADDTKQYKCHTIASGAKLHIADALCNAIATNPRVHVPLLVKVVADWAIANSTDSATRTLPVLSAQDIAAEFKTIVEKQNVFHGIGFHMRKHVALYTDYLPVLQIHSPSICIDDDVKTFCKRYSIDNSLSTFVDLAMGIFSMAKTIKCHLAVDPEIDQLTTVKLVVQIKCDVDILLKLDAAFTKSMIAKLPNHDLHFFVKTYEIINERD